MGEYWWGIEKSPADALTIQRGIEGEGGGRIGKDNDKAGKGDDVIVIGMGQGGSEEKEKRDRKEEGKKGI